MTSTDDDFEIRSKFQQKIDYESVLLQQMGRIAQFRSSDSLKSYEISIETLLLMLPKSLREQAQEYREKEGISRSISNAGKHKYDLLWEYINELLEENNLIYHTKYIKSYS